MKKLAIIILSSLLLGLSGCTIKLTRDENQDIEWMGERDPDIEEVILNNKYKINKDGLHLYKNFYLQPTETGLGIAYKF